MTGTAAVLGVTLWLHMENIFSPFGVVIGALENALGEEYMLRHLSIH